MSPSSFVAVFGREGFRDRSIDRVVEVRCLLDEAELLRYLEDVCVNRDDGRAVYAEEGDAVGNLGANAMQLSQLFSDDARRFAAQ